MVSWLSFTKSLPAMSIARPAKKSVSTKPASLAQTRSFSLIKTTEESARRYQLAQSAQKAAAREITLAKQKAQKAVKALLAAEQVYLDALGAPAIGDKLPLNYRRMVVVKKREFSVGKRISWHVVGSVFEARSGHWVEIQNQLVSLTKAQCQAVAPSARQAAVQAILDASQARTTKLASQKLTLGANELEMLKMGLFDKKAKTFLAPHGYLVGSVGSLRGNAKIIENLGKKGVLVVPKNEWTSSNLSWYGEPLRWGARMSEAMALMDKRYKDWRRCSLDTPEPLP
jgi:hypothetical protein